MMEFLTRRLGGDALLHLLLHALKDGLSLFPFLFLAYLLTEYLEHRAKERTARIIASCGAWGPLAGAVLGIFPQCGFSAAAAGLFASGVISMGTVAAVFLSTSDEMLPILLVNQIPPSSIGVILLIKLLCAAVAGFALDLALRSLRRGIPAHHGEFCEEHCCCREEHGLLRSALRHSLSVTLWIALITFLLNTAVHLVGEDSIARFLTSFPLLGPLLASLVGLIPNCASSVLLTQLWVEGALSCGAMIGGLLTGSGIGLLVLFRTNRSVKENCFLLLFVYLIGALCGVVMDSFGFFLPVGTAARG